MKTDRELMELAAKAAGIPATWDEEGGFMVVPDPDKRQHRRSGDFVIWIPLDDSGHALELAVPLEIEVRNFNGKSHAGQQDKFWCTESWFPDGDSKAATRRSIVRAAAHLAQI